MKTIKFSHRYKKLEALGTEKRARLLEVLEVQLEKLSPEFLAFDTDNGAYSLPKTGPFLLLIFRSQNGIFPTIRRHTDEKADYYRRSRGELFKVEITGK